MVNRKVVMINKIKTLTIKTSQRIRRRKKSKKPKRRLKKIKKRKKRSNKIMKMMVWMLRNVQLQLWPRNKNNRLRIRKHQTRPTWQLKSRQRRRREELKKKRNMERRSFIESYDADLRNQSITIIYLIILKCSRISFCQIL